MKLTGLIKMELALLVSITLTLGFSGVSYAAMNISQTEKENYYSQYLKIADEVSKETGHTVKVIPLDKFSEDEWVTLDEFRERALALANLSVNTHSNNVIMKSTNSATHTESFSVSSVNETLDIDGSFETQYSSYHECQLFSGVNSITSSLSSSSKGEWEQIDYDYDYEDGGRTCFVTISGTYTRLGLCTNVYVDTSFYCNAKGAIS